jgi:hypothetical protein
VQDVDEGLLTSFLPNDDVAWCWACKLGHDPCVWAKTHDHSTTVQEHRTVAARDARWGVPEGGNVNLSFQRARRSRGIAQRTHRAHFDAPASALRRHAEIA